MDMHLYDIAVIPFIIAFSKAIQLVGINPKYVPLLDLVIGLIIGIVYFSDGDYKKGIFLGVYSGLAATGLATGIKVTFFDSENKK